MSSLQVKTTKNKFVHFIHVSILLLRRIDMMIGYWVDNSLKSWSKPANKIELEPLPISAVAACCLGVVVESVTSAESRFSPSGFFEFEYHFGNNNNKKVQRQIAFAETVKP